MYIFSSFLLINDGFAVNSGTLSFVWDKEVPQAVLESVPQGLWCYKQFHQIDIGYMFQSYNHSLSHSNTRRFKDVLETSFVRYEYVMQRRLKKRKCAIKITSLGRDETRFS